MTKIELTDKEMFVTELAIRIVLRELLEREDSIIATVQAGAYNLAVGCFGDKAFRPDNPGEWIQYLQPMRDTINKLDPEYKKFRDELGSKPYLLPEEVGKTQAEFDIEINKEDIGDSIYQSSEYKDALAEMNDIKDRPICVFVYNDLNMPHRIQTMSIVAAEHLQEKGVGRITVACFNQPVKVQ